MNKSWRFFSNALLMRVKVFAQINFSSPIFYTRETQTTWAHVLGAIIFGGKLRKNVGFSSESRSIDFPGGYLTNFSGKGRNMASDWLAQIISKIKCRLRYRVLSSSLYNFSYKTCPQIYDQVWKNKNCT